MWSIRLKRIKVTLKRMGSLFFIFLLLLSLGEWIEGRSWHSKVLIEAFFCSGWSGLIWGVCEIRISSKELGLMVMGYRPAQIYAPLWWSYQLWVGGGLTLCLMSFLFLFSETSTPHKSSRLRSNQSSSSSLSSPTPSSPIPSSSSVLSLPHLNSISSSPSSSSSSSPLNKGKRQSKGFSIQIQNFIPSSLAQTLNWIPKPIELIKTDTQVILWQSHQRLEIDFTQSPLKQRTVISIPHLQALSSPLGEIKPNQFWIGLGIGLLLRTLVLLPFFLFLLYMPSHFCMWSGWFFCILGVVGEHVLL